MKKILLIAVGITLVMAAVIFARNKNTTSNNVYQYELSFQYLMEGSDEVSATISRMNTLTGSNEYYYSMGSETLYTYSVPLYPDKKEMLGKVIQFSMTEKYIEGLSENKYLSGKLVSPDTKEQIGHWSFNLDNKTFTEFSISF